MKLSKFFVAEALVPKLNSETRNDVIRELIESLAQSGRVKKKDIEEIVEQLVERENQGSTGIGKGIAVPHIKHPSVKNIIATVGNSQKGIDSSSLDQPPVNSILLLLSPPNNPDQHLEAMENLFSHLQRDRFRKFLRQAETTEAIVDLLEEADAGNPQSGL